MIGKPMADIIDSKPTRLASGEDIPEASGKWLCGSS